MGFRINQCFCLKVIEKNYSVPLFHPNLRSFHLYDKELFNFDLTELATLPVRLAYHGEAFFYATHLQQTRHLHIRPNLPVTKARFNYRKYSPG